MAYTYSRSQATSNAAFNPGRNITPAKTATQPQQKKEEEEKKKTTVSSDKNYSSVDEGMSIYVPESTTPKKTEVQSASYDIPQKEKLKLVYNNEGQVVGAEDPLAQQSYGFAEETEESIRKKETQRYAGIVQAESQARNEAIAASKISISSDRGYLEAEIKKAQKTSNTSPLTMSGYIAEGRTPPNDVRAASAVEVKALKEAQSPTTQFIKGATAVTRPKEFSDYVFKQEPRFGNKYETKEEGAYRLGALVGAESLVIGGATSAAGRLTLPSISTVGMNIPNIVTGTAKGATAIYAGSQIARRGIEIGAEPLLQKETRAELKDIKQDKKEFDRMIGIGSRASEGLPSEEKGIVDYKAFNVLPSPRQMAQGLSIYFTDKTEFKSAVKAEYKTKGLSDADAEKKAQALTDYYYKVEAPAELAQNIGLEVGGELAGGGIFTSLTKKAAIKGETFTAKESFKYLAPKAALSSGISGAAIEGGFGTYLQGDIRRQPADIKDIATGAVIGGGTALAFGTIVTGLSVRSPKASKAALIGGYFVDPLEPIGDFLGARARKPLGIEEPSILKSGERYMFKGVTPSVSLSAAQSTSPSFTRNIETLLSYAPSAVPTQALSAVPVSSRAQSITAVNIFGGSNVPSINTVPTIGNVPTASEIPTVGEVPTQAQIPVQAEVPSMTNVPVNTPVIAGSGNLPLPMIFGGSSVQGVGKKKKTQFVDELAYAQNIFNNQLMGYGAEKVVLKKTPRKKEAKADKKSSSREKLPFAFDFPFLKGERTRL